MTIRIRCDYLGCENELLIINRGSILSPNEWISHKGWGGDIKGNIHYCDECQKKTEKGERL